MRPILPGSFRTIKAYAFGRITVESIVTSIINCIMPPINGLFKISSRIYEVFYWSFENICELPQCTGYVQGLVRHLILGCGGYAARWIYTALIVFGLSKHRRRQGGNTGNVPPPPKLKKFLQKNGVISEGSIFSNNFSKSR